LPATCRQGGGGQGGRIYRFLLKKRGKKSRASPSTNLVARATFSGLVLAASI